MNLESLYIYKNNTNNLDKTVHVTITGHQRQKL